MNISSNVAGGVPTFRVVQGFTCPRCGKELVVDAEDDTLKCPQMWKTCPGHIADRSGRVLFDPSDVDLPPTKDDAEDRERDEAFDDE